MLVVEGQAEAEVWEHLLQRKVCVSPNGAWTVWQGQDTTEAGPPCASTPGVRPAGREKGGHGEGPRDFIERGWLKPCHSEWASPCFVVPKKVAGEWRLVVDYRGLNAQTQHNSYTMPLIEDMLQKQHRRRIYGD